VFYSVSIAALLQVNSLYFLMHHLKILAWSTDLLHGGCEIVGMWYFLDNGHRFFFVYMKLVDCNLKLSYSSYDCKH